MRILRKFVGAAALAALGATIPTTAMAAPAPMARSTHHVVCSSRVTFDTWFDVSADVTVNDSSHRIEEVNNINGYLDGLTAFETLSYTGGSSSIAGDGQSLTLRGAGTMQSYIIGVPTVQTPVSCTQTWNIRGL